MPIPYDPIQEICDFEKRTSEYFKSADFKSRVDAIAIQMLNNENYKNCSNYTIAQNAVQMVADIDMRINMHVSSLVGVYTKIVNERETENA